MIYRIVYKVCVYIGIKISIVYCVCQCSKCVYTVLCMVLNRYDVKDRIVSVYIRNTYHTYDVVYTYIRF